MRKFILIICFMFMVVSCATVGAIPAPIFIAGTDAVCIGSTLNEDGSPLTDLQGYYFYTSNTSMVYTDDLRFQSANCRIPCSVLGGCEGKYIAVSAYDFSGNESQFAGEVFIVGHDPAEFPASPSTVTVQ